MEEKKRRARPAPKTTVAFLIAIVCTLLVSTQPLPAEKQANTPGEEIEEQDPFHEARYEMVTRQLQGRDISDQKVLDAMLKVKRHEFVPQSQKWQAYADHPLPIGEGQTISQPYIVALMTQSLKPKETDKVLEVGTGSGYQAAVLAELVSQVYSVEILPSLAARANETLKRLNYSNVEVDNRDGYYGWEQHAPYDAIIVTAAATHVPPKLIEQLKEDGLLIIPLGSTLYYQTLTLIRKKPGSEVETRYISSVSFVPMTGEIQKH